MEGAASAGAETELIQLYAQEFKGSPVYYDYPTAVTRAFLERFMFPLDPYMVSEETHERIRYLARTVPTAMIYTMNCPDWLMERVNYPTILGSNEAALKRLFGYCETLYSCDTYQYTDYAKYSCLSGVKEANPNAETEIIHLYDYTYTGCKSCFACQRAENRKYPGCRIKDSIHDILDSVRHADGIILASPIYYFDITAQTKSFLERLFYSGKTDKPVPSVFIYSMNATEEQKDQFGFEGALCTSRYFMESNFQYKPECVYSFNTFQYNDRENLSEDFRRFVPEKLTRQKEQFPIDLKNAHNAGVRLVENITAIGL